MPEQTDESVVENPVTTQEASDTPPPPPTDETVVTTSDDGESNEQPERDLSKINFNAFKEARAGVNKEEVKEAVKTEAAKVEEPEVKQPAPVKAKPAPVKRDLSGIDEADQPYFKQVSNESFARLKEVYLNNKKAQEEIAQLKTKASQPAAPSYFSGHPEAYTLTQDYQQATGALKVAASVEDFLVAQLDNISKGEKWEGLTTDKDGNIYRTGTQSEPTERARWELEKQLRQVQDARIGYERKITELKGGYSKSYDADIALLKATEEKYFPGYDKEDHPTYKAQQEFLKILPASQQSNPLAKTLAKTVANNAIFKSQLDAANAKVKELEAQLAKLKTPASNGQQPGKDKTVAGPVVNNSGKLSYSEMKRRREAGEMIYA